MVAITPYMELKRAERVRADDPQEDVIITDEDVRDLAGLGVANAPRDADGTPLDPLAKPHTELSRLLWARTLIAKALVGCKFKLVYYEQRLMVEVVPPVDKKVIPWSNSASPLKRFSLFSTNSKMECPTFDLPAGIGQLGGACPGAAFAQSTVPTAILQTRDDKHGEVVMSDQMKKGIGFLLEEVAKDWSHLPDSERKRESQVLNLNSTVCTRCVAGDTLVMVRGHGLMQIQDVVDMGDVEVWSGVDWRRTHAVMTKVSETVEVTFAGGRRLRCTPDHPIMTTEGEVQAQDLVAGEHSIDVTLPRESPFPHTAVLPSCALVEPHFNEKRGVLPTEWSRDVGVWLGYLMGDGWFLENLKHPTLGICAGTEDVQDLERLADMVAPWSGTRAEVSMQQDKPNEGLVPAGGITGRVHWHLKSMVAFAKSLGLSKRGSLKTPAAVWEANEAGVAGYLSGLFSTDGSVARWPKRVAVSFANTSRTLCEEVQQLLFSFGIRSNICEYTSNAKRGYKMCWKVDIVAHESVQRFAQHIGFFNARKQQKLLEGLEAVGERKSLRRPVAVESVMPAHVGEPVFDLINVGDEHQFIANGIPVHNCYASGGKYGEAVVQFAEVARFALVSSMLAQNEEGLVDLLVRALEETQKWESIDAKRHGIRPVRVHSSGDFFSPKYASMWLKVAAKLHNNAILAKKSGDTSYLPIVLWAPTRTHVLKGWSDFWKGQKIPPNFMIRPSAYSVGDPAPFIKRKSPTGTKGTSVLFADDSESRLTKGGHGDGTKFDWQCGVYDLGKGEKTCVKAKAPDGKVGCRACWVRPDLAVNYVIH
jgi:hypothetical protein